MWMTMEPFGRSSSEIILACSSGAQRIPAYRTQPKKGWQAITKCYRARFRAKETKAGIRRRYRRVPRGGKKSLWGRPIPL